MKHITDFTIVSRRQLGEHYFSLTLQHPDTLPPVAAGQFVEVEVRHCREVLLRRPISVHDVDPAANTLTLLIQTVGKGTRQLATLAVGPPSSCWAAAPASSSPCATSLQPTAQYTTPPRTVPSASADW